MSTKWEESVNEAEGHRVVQSVTCSAASLHGRWKTRQCSIAEPLATMRWFLTFKLGFGPLAGAGTPTAAVVL